MIAVVDDDAAMCQSLERLLRSYGFEARAYASAHAFLTSGQLSRTTCLILDVHMPGESGLELQERLRSEGNQLPMIFITGYIDEAIRERAFRCGAVEVLEKPFDDALLIEKLKEALLQRSMPS